MTDEAIMEAVKNGNLQQASVLFDRYNKRIFNFLARQALDRESGEDLAQTVFLRMLKYRQSYRPGLKFETWIFQIARNVFSDHYQASKKFSKKVDVETVSHMEAGGEDWENRERVAILEKSMQKLSDEQRELLVLTRFQEMKYEQVAAIMNTTVANIKVKVHRAIGKLRTHYFELEKS